MLLQYNYVKRGSIPQRRYYSIKTTAVTHTQTLGCDDGAQVRFVDFVELLGSSTYFMHVRKCRYYYHKVMMIVRMAVEVNEFTISVPYICERFVSRLHVL